MSWQKSNPTNSGLLINAPAQIRGNWDALELGADAALQITNVKVASAAAIEESKTLFAAGGHGHTGGTGGKQIALATAVSGTLPTANGGTASSSAKNTANGVVVLDNDAKLPAADGSQLTALATAGRPGTLTAGTPCVQNPFVIKTKTTQAHGLGAIPTLVDVYFECLSAEAGYDVGDRVMAIVEDSQNAGSMARWDATNVYILSSNNAPYILNGTTPEGIIVLTAAKWKVVAVPYKLN